MNAEAAKWGGGEPPGTRVGPVGSHFLCNAFKAKAQRGRGRYEGAEGAADWQSERERETNVEKYTTSAINAAAVTFFSPLFFPPAPSLRCPCSAPHPHIGVLLGPFSTSSITFRLMAAEIRPMSMKFAASDCRLRNISSSQLVQAAAFAQ